LGAQRVSTLELAVRRSTVAVLARVYWVGRVAGHVRFLRGGLFAAPFAARLPAFILPDIALNARGEWALVVREEFRRGLLSLPILAEHLADSEETVGFTLWFFLTRGM
jgi:hypothetical protein